MCSSLLTPSPFFNTRFARAPSNPTPLLSQPAASRQQSSEIFLVCEQYLAPTVIDPRLLDPKTVFEQNFTGDEKKKRTIFDKDYVQKKNKSRGGYDEDVDASLRRIKPASEFVACEDPIQMLTDCHGFSFLLEDDKPLLDHPSTSQDIKESMADLKLLGKSEFKALLKWRLSMIAEKKAADDSGDEENGEKPKERYQKTSDETEEEIAGEIEEMKAKKIRKLKREKKKERAGMAKLRERKRLGMEGKGVEPEQFKDVFSLNQVKNVKELERVGLGDVREEEESDIGSDDSDAQNDSGSDDGELDDEAKEKRHLMRMEMDMDSQYDKYLIANKKAQAGTKLAKRSKKEAARKMAENQQADTNALALADVDGEKAAYAKMLTGKNSRDSDESDGASSSDDGFFSDEDGSGDEEETASRKKKARKVAREASNKESNPLLVKRTGESRSTKVERFMSNPLFDGLDDDEEEEEKKMEDDEESGDEKPNTADASGNVTYGTKTKKGKVLNADDVMSLMPRTDKEIRHAQRQKANERLARRDDKREALKGDAMEIVETNIAGSNADAELALLDPASKKRILKARELIKAGLGSGAGDDNTAFEIAPALERVDERKYDSEEEDYDSDDHAELLALGTMMLKKSKAKAMVDASYNRFANNDPQDLPEWFADDERRNHRPQLPIPAALVEKMKAKYALLSAKPIKKVVEARARKSKRASSALKAAKAKAAAVANSAEMSEAQKLKAISKAMRGHDTAAPGKQYVVATKQGNRGGKGVKLVDKREKCDKRAMKRAASKKKGSGKKR